MLLRRVHVRLSSTRQSTSGDNWKRLKKRKFVDWKRVNVYGGKGGSGCVSFRREAHTPMGGPDGGDGGRGGAVIFVANPSTKSLLNLRNMYKAPDGTDGHGKNCHGKNGKNIVISVPLGTIFKVNDELVADLANSGDRHTAARGGKGGNGNIAFISSTNQAPLRNTTGEEGDNRTIELELKTIADIGLVGFPNAGKSTLLRTLSRASPEVAAYPFTTLNPHVGIMELPDHPDSLIAVADIPGLLPGAHRNYGLGHSFLRHVERCRSLLYVLDCSHNSPPLSQQLQQLQNELFHYSPGLPDKAKLIITNKMDLDGADVRVRKFSQQAKLPIVPVSGLEKWNIDHLKRLLYDVYCTSTL